MRVINKFVYCIVLIMLIQSCNFSCFALSLSVSSEDIIKDIVVTSFPKRTVIVNVPNDSLQARTILQHAIDSCSYLGGGKVVVKSGNYYLNGALYLKSDVNLHLERGCYLRFSGRASDFLPVVLTRWEGTELYGYSPMIYAYKANNIAITGQGTIDAQGGIEFAAWSEMETKDRDLLREMGDNLVPVYKRVFGFGSTLRPSCIQPYSCSRVLIEGITIKDSPFWTIHPLYCDNVIVRGVTIDSHFPNNDGCDPESTCNVLIENCVFRTGDDAVAIKSGRDRDGRHIGRASKNIVIRNCKFYSECNGLCIGSEISGGVSNVYVNNVEIGTVKNAIYFKSNKDRGGYIRNIFIDNVKVERTKGAVLRFETNYFGFRGGNYCTLYENFLIKNVKANTSDNYAVIMDGNANKKIQNVQIENFTVLKAKHLYHVCNIENVHFIKSSVNNVEIPPTPKEHKEMIMLKIY